VVAAGAGGLKALSFEDCSDRPILPSRGIAASLRSSQ
jgi:hypothetical protein